MSDAMKEIRSLIHSLNSDNEVIEILCNLLSNRLDAIEEQMAG